MSRNYSGRILVVSGVALVLASAALLYFWLASNNAPVSQMPLSAATVTTSSAPSPTATTAPFIPAPTLKEAQEIVLPFQNKIEIKVFAAPFPPSISKETALKALRSRQHSQASWDLAKSTIDGKPVTVIAVFGLVTQGKPGPSGWSGMRNIGLENCPIEGDCTATGQVLDHLENRPMWVIDIGGIYQPYAGDPSIENNHIVFGIDTQTLQRFNFGPYKL